MLISVCVGLVCFCVSPVHRVARFVFCVRALPVCVCAVSVSLSSRTTRRLDLRTDPLCVHELPCMCMSASTPRGQALRGCLAFAGARVFVRLSMQHVWSVWLCLHYTHACMHVFGRSCLVVRFKLVMRATHS
eukprot:GDKI01015932.1.p1 GENE.GDKI01015932.1~~GDKI01015932.1.p1  ORF type:complete len:132 (+),score=20.14 GDKI01015932.1:123-518(+)